MPLNVITWVITAPEDSCRKKAFILTSILLQSWNPTFWLAGTFTNLSGLPTVLFASKGWLVPLWDPTLCMQEIHYRLSYFGVFNVLVWGELKIWQCWYLFSTLLLSTRYQHIVLWLKFAIPHQKGFNTKPIESRHTQDFYHLLNADNGLSPLLITS